MKKLLIVLGIIIILIVVVYILFPEIFVIIKHNISLAVGSILAFFGITYTAISSSSSNTKLSNEKEKEYEKKLEEFIIEKEKVKNAKDEEIVSKDYISDNVLQAIENIKKERTLSAMERIKAKAINKDKEKE